MSEPIDVCAFLTPEELEQERAEARAEGSAQEREACKEDVRAALTTGLLTTGQVRQALAAIDRRARSEPVSPAAPVENCYADIVCGCAKCVTRRGATKCEASKPDPFCPNDGTCWVDTDGGPVHHVAPCPCVAPKPNPLQKLLGIAPDMPDTHEVLQKRVLDLEAERDAAQDQCAIAERAANDAEKANAREFGRLSDGPEHVEVLCFMCRAAVDSPGAFRGGCLNCKLDALDADHDAAEEVLSNTVNQLSNANDLALKALRAPYCHTCKNWGSVEASGWYANGQKPCPDCAERVEARRAAIKALEGTYPTRNCTSVLRKSPDCEATLSLQKRRSVIDCNHLPVGHCDECFDNAHGIQDAEWCSTCHAPMLQRDAQGHVVDGPCRCEPFPSHTRPS